MTGSLVYTRQHSSTAGYSNVDKMERPKLRRWWSADKPYSFEVITDEQQKCEEIPTFQRNQTPSDFDSGVEDSDQHNVNEDEHIGNFGACSDEEIEESPATPIMNEQPQNIDQQLPINVDPAYLVSLASLVSDDEKKEFCKNTAVVFHAEFARLIYYPIASINNNYQYRLFAQDDFMSDPRQWPGAGYIKLDNAKAQFRCPTRGCNRLWTSMRARIAFVISQPQPNGFVVLKICGQHCEDCHTLADPLWYMEEVCRVMKNLSDSIIASYFPSMITYENLPAENTNRRRRRSRHDPNQRQGKPLAIHNKNLCEACQLGICYA